MPDFEDTNKKGWMKLFRHKEIFDQAVVEIMGEGAGIVALKNIVYMIY